MSKDAFDILLEKMIKSNYKSRFNRDTKNRGCRNGKLDQRLMLSAGLRMMATGQAYDISISHGISLAEVYKCLWKTVDAVNNIPELEISYPSSYVTQDDNAKAFAEKSDAKFDCCVGAIDGMLVWTEQPRVKEAQKMNCGVRHFLNGHRGKFGYNLQAICDSNGKFLEVWIGNPASSSDYLSFIRSSFYTKLSKPGFIKRGYVIFGDNAYVNGEHMVVPFKGAGSGKKDDFTFYHSQLRINIECALGQLVHNWSIL